MGAFLIQQGATVLCSHSGQAMPTATNAQVTINGQPTVTTTAPWQVAGCPLIPPPLPPCITAQWVTGTTRVTSNGQPLVVMSGQAICAPTGTPLLPVSTQTRVTAM
jgi:uncharacterized Zn-binding protein involved in type VI secretion